METSDKATDMPLDSRGRVMETYYSLERELLWARRLMTLLSQLFGDKEVMSLWETLCPYSMGLVQVPLGRDLLLTLSKICDPARQMGRDNSTFLRLVELLREDGADELARKVELGLGEVADQLGRIKAIRNRRVAHADFETLAGRTTLPPILVGHINEVVVCVRKLLWEVRRHYGFGSMFAFDGSYDGEHHGNLTDLPDGGLVHLIDILKSVRGGKEAAWPDPMDLLF